MGDENPTRSDDFSNAPGDSRRGSPRSRRDRVEIVAGDIRDPAALDAIFARFPIDAVVHLAGLKAVGEFVAQPLRYYDVNVGGAVALIEAMLRHRVRRLVFSSSATVYGAPASNPIPEEAPLAALNPYGRTKWMVERILEDAAAAEPGFAAVSLRYFNPVGAHPSGVIGENPRGVPNNLFPYIAQTAAGLRSGCKCSAATTRPPTAPGSATTCTSSTSRAGISRRSTSCSAGEAAGRHVPVNLGCGRGYSVLEAIGRSGGPPAGRFPRNRPAPPPAMRRNASPTRPAPRRSSAGGPRGGTSTRCAPTTRRSRAGCWRRRRLGGSATRGEARARRSTGSSAQSRCRAGPRQTCRSRIGRRSPAGASRP